MTQPNSFIHLSQNIGKFGIAVFTGLLLSLLTNNSLHAATLKKDAVLDKNLIVNGNGEQGTCDSIGNAVGSNIPSIPAWETTGSFSVLCYGATGFEFVNPAGQTVSVSGLPDTNSPGPENRGKNLFFGGANRESSSASQIIDVAQLASIIDITISHTLCRGLYGLGHSSTVLLVSWTTLHSIHYFAFLSAWYQSLK